MKIPKTKGLYSTVRSLFTAPAGRFLLGAFVGLIVFAQLFGFGAVNPLNIAWIQNIQGDMTQHYMSWSYYRDAPWQFPDIGKINSLAYPAGISLVYMDVIPLLAIVFKLFSGVLPEHFQYFGLFSLLSFMLHGGFAALIIGRFTNRTILSVLGAIVLVCTPLIISRSFGHTALTAHWLILAALYFLIRFYQDKPSLRSQIIIWSALMVLAVLTHAYFIPIIGAVFLSSLVLQHKSFRTSMVLFVVPIVAALTVFALIGGLSRGMQTHGDSGLGLYSTNILGPVIPIGYSFFINSTFAHQQWEGLAYPGLGVLLLIPVLWFIFLYESRKTSVRTLAKKTFAKLKNIRALLLIGIVLSLYILALSPIVYVGNLHLFTVPTPGIVESLWEIFRSTGRLFWPIYYALIIGILAIVVAYTRRWNYGIVVLFLLPFVLLQSVDVIASAIAIKKGNIVSDAAARKKVLNPLNSRFVHDFCQKDRVVLVDNSIEAGIDMFRDLSDYIVTCQPTLTAGYFSRFPKKSILTYAEEKRTALKDGSIVIPDNHLYLTRSDLFVNEINPEKYTTQRHGNYWVILNR